MDRKTCYICNAIATNKEHVPPVCIFPEQKDVGIDLRANLITVPSCEEHNLKKCADDEFLMASLAGIVGNNFVGYVQNKKKVRRAFTRNSALQHLVIKNPEEYEFTVDGVVFPVLLGKPDGKRLTKCFKQIARGLYFHEYGKTFDGELKVLPAFLDFKDEELTKIKSLMIKWYEESGASWPVKGNNTSIFYYQISPLDEHGIFCIAMTFYEGTRVFAVFKVKDAPFNLVGELIRAGIPMTLEFKDGETVDFNKNKNNKKKNLIPEK